MSARRTGGAGFTLIEVLAAVLLTSIIVTAAVAFFINLSNATTTATRKTREGRHAAAVLDRVARDLEGTLLLVKPADVDPLEYPWLFYGVEHDGMDGADRLKFVTTSNLPRESETHSSDVAQVAYLLEPAGDGASYDLLRWTSPHLPEGLDRSFPDPGDPRVQRVAEGVVAFRARFLDETGEWRNDWDSSSVAESSLLPAAVEIHVALLDPDDLQADAETGTEIVEPPGSTRRVVLPVRPIDLQAMLAAADGTAGSQDQPADDEEGDEEDDEFQGAGNENAGLGGSGEESGTMTVAECIAANRSRLTAMGATDGLLAQFASDAPAPPEITIYGQTFTCTR